ncbi:MAG: DNA integrity scanning protein DisA nucleotide-binding domain protein [Clostridia bacterium]|nr:DNA integrity scanning protein DisA nucleotide-binding domain protein [Clostridia bacterium]
MIDFILEKIVPLFTKITIPQIAMVVIVALGLFFLFSLLSKNNAGKISFVFILYVILTSVLCVLLKVSVIIYALLIVAFIVCVIVMFSTEIKRSVWDSKSSKTISSEAANTVRNNHKLVTHNINEIVKALQNMSKNDIGAILVFSNTKIPTSIIDSGVKLDSDISSALIESIFFPKTPLHDGAIIIQNDKILAAGCFLPLSQEGDLPKELGTRHRAGIGVTEMLNVTAIIVSEETGIISIAKGGKITRYADSETLRKTLKEYYWQDLIESGKEKPNKEEKGGRDII